jgi:hypothetical protein
MNETLEQFRARMKRELVAANNEDLMREVKAVQKTRGWDFTRAWTHVLAEQPAFLQSSAQKVDSVAAKEKSYAVVEARAHDLIRESGGQMTMGRALHLARAQQQSVTTSPKPSVKAVEPKPRMMLIKGSTGTWID